MYLGGLWPAALASGLLVAEGHPISKYSKRAVWVLLLLLMNPSSSALLGLGGLALILCRRK